MTTQQITTLITATLTFGGAVIGIGASIGVLIDNCKNKTK